MATGYRSCIRAAVISSFHPTRRDEGHSQFVRDELPRSGGGGGESRPSCSVFSPRLWTGQRSVTLAFAVAAAGSRQLTLPASGGCAPKCD